MAATETERQAVAGEINGQILEYAWKLKRRGLADVTVESRAKRLNILLKKGAKLTDPETVETILATETWTAPNKYLFVRAYKSYCKTMGVAWEPMKVKYEPPQQFLPYEDEVDALVAGCGRRTATLFQTLKDTGARLGEGVKIKYSDVDARNLEIRINNPEKNSRSRRVRVTEKTISMISALPKKYGEYIFNPNPAAVEGAYGRQRNKLAIKLQNPRLKQIHLHTFRHFFATHQYRRTHFNGKRVQTLMGHKCFSSTDRYLHDIDTENIEYETERAETIDKAEALRRQGYDLYDTFVENGKTVKLYSRMK